MNEFVPFLFCFIEMMDRSKFIARLIISIWNRYLLSTVFLTNVNFLRLCSVLYLDLRWNHLAVVARYLLSDILIPWCWGVGVVIIVVLFKIQYVSVYVNAGNARQRDGLAAGVISALVQHASVCWSAARSSGDGVCVNRYRQ